jgi:hypothetical protein
VYAADIVDRRIAGLVAAGTLVGCTSVPPGDPQRDAALKAFAAAPGMAGIYVFRDRTPGEFVRLGVGLNGVPMGRTDAGTYLYRDVAPGRHVVTSHAADTIALEVDVGAGSLAFVRQDVAPGFFGARGRLARVDEAQGREGVQASRLVRGEAPMQTIEVHVEAASPEWSGPLDCRASNVFGAWSFVAPGPVEVAAANAPLRIDCTPPGSPAAPAGETPAATSEVSVTPGRVASAGSGALTGAGIGAGVGVALGVMTMPVVGPAFVALLAAGTAMRGAEIGGMFAASSAGTATYPSPIVVRIGHAPSPR